MKNLPNIDGLRDCHTKQSKSDGEEKISCDSPYMWTLKRKYTNELIEQKQSSRLENGLMAAVKGKIGEGRVREFGRDMHTLPYLKWITSKGLRSSTGNSTQCYVAA